MIFNIRLIAQKDNSRLAHIIRNVFEEFEAPQTGTVYSDPTTDELSLYFQKDGSVGWVAEEEGEILGCCGIYPTDNLPEGCVELVKFYLSRKARGRGIGKALMEKAIMKAKKLGYHQMYIESLPHFDRAVRIYEKQGFQRILQPLGNSGHPGCNIWMVKDL